MYEYPINLFTLAGKGGVFKEGFETSLAGYYLEIIPSVVVRGHTEASFMYIRRGHMVTEQGKTVLRPDNPNREIYLLVVSNDLQFGYESLGKGDEPLNLWIGVECPIPIVRRGDLKTPNKAELIVLNEGEKAYVVDIHKTVAKVEVCPGEMKPVLTPVSAEEFSGYVFKKGIEAQTHQAITWAMHVLAGMERKSMRWNRLRELRRKKFPDKQKKEKNRP